MTAAPTYQLNTTESPLWMGMGPVRLAVAGLSLLVGVLASYAGVNLGLAAAPIGVAAIWCLGSFGGQPLHARTSAAASYLSRISSGGRTWKVPLFVHALRADERLELPPECGRLTLRPLEVDGVEIGALLERRREGWHVGCVLRVSADSDFALAEPSEQARRLHLWGDVLTALCGEHADRCRLQWIEKAHPVVGSGDLPGDLAEVVTAEAREHVTLLALWLSTGERDIDRAFDQLAPLVRLVASRLLVAELVMAPLTRSEVIASLVSDSESSPDQPEMRVPAAAARRESWDHTLVDGALHRGFLITGWPRLPSHPGWMGPLLQEAPSVGRRHVAVHFLAVRQDVANRRARAARQSALLDADERSRLGFGVGARERRSQASAESIEDELAAGHAQHRVAGLIVVSAGCRADLDQACRETLAQASAARLEVRALDGQHALAWAAGLPLCRLRHRAVA